ncbi:hypothetical protein JST97_20750 [bacterium]|nr:hypothetical protein [bacterium]
MKYTVLALAAIALALWDSRPARKKSLTIEEKDGLTVARVDGQIVRVRGGYEEVMSFLDPSRKTEKPPLPDDLDIDSLKSYHCGCPHCGKMSLYGENTWHYQVLSMTRERWDNTTTYLTRCKSCLGLMKSTVDHQD